MADNASWGIKAEQNYLLERQWDSKRLRVRGVTYEDLLNEYIAVHEKSDCPHHLAGVLFARQLLEKLKK